MCEAYHEAVQTVNLIRILLVYYYIGHLLSDSISYVRICISLKVAVNFFRRTMHHVDKRYIDHSVHRYDIIRHNNHEVPYSITCKSYYLTMRTLGGIGTMHKIFTYYAGIMLDAFLYLLCSKLCWHNWRRPGIYLH